MILWVLCNIRALIMAQEPPRVLGQKKGGEFGTGSKDWGFEDEVAGLRGALGGL